VLILEDFKSLCPEVLILGDFKSLFPEVLIVEDFKTFIMSVIQKLSKFLEVLILKQLACVPFIKFFCFESVSRAALVAEWTEPGATLAREDMEEEMKSAERSFDSLPGANSHGRSVGRVDRARMLGSSCGNGRLRDTWKVITLSTIESTYIYRVFEWMGKKEPRLVSPPRGSRRFALRTQGFRPGLVCAAPPGLTLKVARGYLRRMPFRTWRRPSTGPMRNPRILAISG
jgi:hypothetical protein